MNTYDGSKLLALGDATRLQIFERLARGALPVGELAREFPISRPAVSQHLRVLKDAGLVRDRRDGNRRLYELDANGINALRNYFDRFWTTALTRFKAAAERPNERKKRAI